MSHLQQNQQQMQQQQMQQFGAHELMEAHEVLTDIIDGINQFQLYRPHITDSQLEQILDRQVQHMTREYDNLVSYLTSQRGVNPQIYQSMAMGQTKYGLRNPSPQSPNQSQRMMDDRDVASGMLGCAKASALLCTTAALECADPQLRRMMIQCTVSCTEKAFEVFQYMNEKGYYHVPTLNSNTQQTMINTYQPWGQFSGGMQGQIPTSQPMMQNMGQGQFYSGS